MEVSLLNIWNLLYNFICIVGCTYQLHHIISAYFKYETVSRITYHPPHLVPTPELHYCFRYLEDGLNWTAVELKYGKLYDHDSINERKWLDIVTIKDIFEYSYDFDIDVCLHRDTIGHNMVQENQCTYFNVTKYIQQQYICYMVSAKKDNSIEFGFIFKSLYWERILYELRYSNSLSNATKVRPTLSSGSHPYFGRIYAQGYHKEKRTAMSLSVACQSIVHIFLGYPYDKFTCSSYGEEYFKCYDKCLNNLTMKYLDRKPFFNFHMDPSDESKLISHSMLQNITIQKSLLKWDNYCNTQCPMFPCKFDFCITIGHMDARVHDHYGSDAGSVIRVESDPYPIVTTMAVPNLSMLDFFIFILSSLGSWFGLVIISCNPIAFMIKLYDSMRQAKLRTRRNIHKNRCNSRRDLVIKRMKMPSRYYEKYCPKGRN